MSFERSSHARPPIQKKKTQPVFCVGWRAFVHWPPAPVGKAGPVPLLNAEGRQLANDLADGQEVEILGWRPRSREGTSYHIRRLLDRSEWWVEVSFLRRHSTLTPGAANQDVNR